MSFYTKYEILALLRDDAQNTGVKTFSAKHMASGQTVGVHLLFENPPGQPAAILDRVRALGPEHIAHVIEVGNHEGTYYVVTTEWTQPQGFDEWLGRPPSVAPATRPAAESFSKPGTWRIPNEEFGKKFDPGIQPSPSASPIPDPGGFTRMFSISPRSAGGGEMATSSAIHPSAIRPIPAPFKPTAPPPPPAPRPIQPDEATRIFSTQSSNVPVPPVATTAPPRTVQSDESTRMFATQPSPVSAPVPLPPVAPTAPPRPVQADESTRMFTPPPTGAPPPATTPLAPPPAVGPGPGEFTRMFQIPSVGTPSQAAPLGVDMTAETRKVDVSTVKPAPGPGEFTRMFQVPSQSPAAPTPALPAPEPQQDLSATRTMQIPNLVSPAPAAAPTPGEFTQMFQAMPREAQPSQVAAVPAAPPQPAPVSAPPAVAPAGEFTQMFQAMPREAVPSQVKPVPAAPPPPVVAPPPAAPAQVEGEFTRMFQVPAATPSTVTPIVNRGNVPPPQAPPPAAPAAGDFTKIFQTGIGPSVPAPPPSQLPSSGGPGEFTKFFQVPVESAAPRPHPALEDPFGKSTPPPTSQSSGGAGEFTQMFGVPSRPSQGGQPEPYKPATPPSFGPQSSSTATGAFATPSSRPQFPQGSGGAPSGPGEYTQMFSAPAPAPMPAPAAPQPPAAAKPNYLPLFIIFGVLFIIVIAVIVYFLMHRGR